MVKTKILKCYELSSNHRVTIEKIIDGEFVNHYVVKSYSKALFRYKLTVLSAMNVETDFEGKRIVKIDFPNYRMLSQAIFYAKYIIQERYPVWKRIQQI